MQQGGLLQIAPVAQERVETQGTPLLNKKSKKKQKTAGTHHDRAAAAFLRARDVGDSSFFAFLLSFCYSFFIIINYYRLVYMNICHSVGCFCYF